MGDSSYASFVNQEKDTPSKAQFMNAKNFLPLLKRLAQNPLQAVILEKTQIAIYMGHIMKFKKSSSDGDTYICLKTSEKTKQHD